MSEESAKQAGQESTPGDSDLEPLDWEDEVFIDVHKTAVEKALESSDGACGTILTACFSLATAYGAVIALVAPKDQQAPLLVVAPFVLLVAGAVVALIGKAAGISLDRFATTGQVKKLVEDAVGQKRKASWWAVGFAAAGVILAGIVVFATYSEPDEFAAENSEIILSNAGKAHVADVCGDEAESVFGNATFSERWVTIELNDESTANCGGVMTLTLPAASVAYVRSTP